MKVTEKGPGEPEVAVVYCTHGDETAGKKAVEKLLDSGFEFRRAVKFVFANEKAYREGKRFIDTDLNRSFPGDTDSDSYEKRVAAEMMEELRGLKVLDLHETGTSPSPFALFTWMDEETIDTVQSTGVDRAVEISYTPGCGINNYGGVEVETGPKGTEKSERMAFQVLKTFLVNNGVLSGERNRKTPEMYSVYSVKVRPEGEWKVEAKNFQRIQRGENIAVKEDQKIVAEEAFMPVLMGEGYDEIFGFKAARLEKLEGKVYDKRAEK